MAPIVFEGIARREERSGHEAFLMSKFAGAIEETVHRKIIVDTRELRSSLPYVLYRHKFVLEPRTIDIGDYILTPTICIERKSTADLISSLNSGRLYTQVEQMSRKYETCILLIEFDENKPFSLLPGNDIRSEISIADVASKLCLLLLHFRTLKIIWSPSLAATAEMFLDLKRDQPDPICQEEESSGRGAGTEPGDPTARDLLLSLPGVNQQNCYIIMKHVKNVRELCTRSRADLEDLLGVENARKLYTFLHEPIVLSK